MDDYPDVYMPVDIADAPPPRPPIEILEYVVPFSTPFYEGHTYNVLNHAIMQFTSEMAVPESMAEQAAKLDQLAIPLRAVSLEDIDDVITCVFESGMQHCSRRYRAEPVLVDNVMKTLKELAVLSTTDEGNDGLMIFRMMPVVALDRRRGILVAYALGQLLAPEANISNKRMLIKGYAMNVNIQEILIKSMAESLICDVEMVPQDDFI